MSAENLNVSFTTDKSREAVYDAVNNVRGWWSETLEGRTSQVGDVFFFKVDGIHYSTIQVTELVPGELVKWHVLDARLTFLEDQAEWVGTEIRFDIDKQGKGTGLRFTHVGLTPSVECYGACSEGWAFYAGDSLRALIETGTGTPNSLPAEVKLLEQASAT